MKPAIITISLIIFASLVKAQQSDTTQQNKIFTAVEIEPSFPGGVERFYLYLQNNIVYPPDAVKKRIEGRVFVGFVVEKDGSLTDIKVLRGVSPDIDAEAIRVVGISPKWRPGIQNGRAIRIQYNISIVFKLPPLQISNDKEQHLMDSLRQVPFDQKVFTAVEKEPEFLGGLEKFFKYLQNNLKYPDEARKNDIQGKVFVSFVVEKDGSLTDVKIAKSLSPETDAEAIRLIQNSPKWMPGFQNGRPVRVAYTMPIMFPFLSN